MEKLWKELAPQEGGTELSKPDFLAASKALERYTVDMPSSSETDRLLQKLWDRELPGEMPPAAGKPAELAMESAESGWSKQEQAAIIEDPYSWYREPDPADIWERMLRTLRTVRSQTRLLSWPYWLVSAVVILMGGWFGFFSGGQGGNPLALVAPVLAVISVCAAFRTFGSPMLELELTLPVTPAQLVYGRLLLILGYNTIAALAVSPMAASGREELGGFILGWLFPLAVTCMVALAAVLYVHPYGAAGLSLAVWGVYLTLENGYIPHGLAEAFPAGEPAGRGLALFALAVCLILVQLKVRKLGAGMRL